MGSKRRKSDGDSIDAQSEPPAKRRKSPTGMVLAAVVIETEDSDADGVEVVGSPPHDLGEDNLAVDAEEENSNNDESDADEEDETSDVVEVRERSPSIPCAGDMAQLLEGQQDFDIPTELLNDAFCVWAFLQTFSDYLRLSPFPVGPFLSCIAKKGAVPELMVHIQCSLLRLLKDLSGEEAREICRSTWVQFMRNFVAAEVEAERLPKGDLEALEGQGFGFLAPSLKMKLLMHQVQTAIETTTFRELLLERQKEANALARVRERERAKAEGGLRKSASRTWSPPPPPTFTPLARPASPVPPTQPPPDAPRAVTARYNADMNAYKEKCVNVGRERDRIDKINKRNEAKFKEANGENKASEASRRKANIKEKAAVVEAREEALRAEEACAVRCEPLGYDRRYNRYWLWPSDERLFVEENPFGAPYREGKSVTDRVWRYLERDEALLVSSQLDPKLRRERRLLNAFLRARHRLDGGAGEDDQSADARRSSRRVRETADSYENTLGSVEEMRRSSRART